MNLRSGAVMGFLLAANGLLVLYITINLFKLYYGDDWEGLFEAITGYGLGRSSMDLFGRVSGGIYTKAADVGADLVESGYYAPNSTYKTNLSALLLRLTSNTNINYGFYSSSYGISDTVYATGLCRGDVTPQTCRNCLNETSFFLLKQCPLKKRVAGGYDKCMLYYNEHSITYGYKDSDFEVCLKSETSTPDWDYYNYALKNLLSKLRVKAATTDSHLNRKFAAGNATAPNSQHIYAVVQCTPDLTEAECNDCLDGAFSEIPNCCSHRTGGVIIKLSCNFRFENYSFYDPTVEAVTLQLPSLGSPPPSSVPSPTANSSQSTHHGNGNRSRATIAKVVPVVAFVGLLTFVYLCSKMRKQTKLFESEANHEDEIKPTESSEFGFDTIKVATNNFSNANKLGQGGFGPVYKGILFNGQETAVKRLSSNSGQGDIEFKNELFLMARLQHRNLVRLLGFCIEREERLLVYEFLPNRSLDNFLFDQTHANASKIVGTLGYMAPEYARHGKFSVKSDVFSFGVIILEIVSGQKNGSFRNGENVEHLLSFAWKNWKKGTAFNIIDPTLNDALRDEIVRCIHIGLLCVQERVVDRPTLASVMLMLSSCSLSLPVPLQPAFFMSDECLSEIQSIESNEQRSNSVEDSANEASISSLYPR
ncbi:hypothetical protein RJT34_25275 [Clitoria ternatea]|uniref:H(+)-exporting diphosphatase n=1 Tax=Clitoria ternatea TaxID=43366 RepID=A0AAN9FW93_CLITE